MIEQTNEIFKVQRPNLDPESQLMSQSCINFESSV